LSLKKRLLIVACLLVVLASLAAWATLQRVTAGIIEQWGEHLVDAQVRHDITRLAQALEREIALAQQLAGGLLPEEWATHLDNPEYRAALLEGMRHSGYDAHAQSYRVLLLNAEPCYYQDADGPNNGLPQSRPFDPKHPLDASLRQQAVTPKGIQLNLFHDDVNGGVRLWVSALLTRAGQPIGALSIGTPLETLLPEAMSADQPGMTTLLVDPLDSIQLYRVSGRLEQTAPFSTLQPKYLGQLVDKPVDRQRIRALQQQLESRPSNQPQTLNDMISLGGRRYLVAVTYLPALGWHQLSLLDLDSLLPLSRLIPVVVVFFLVLLVVLLLLHAVLCHLLLNPLAALERAMADVRAGKPLGEQQPLPSGEGEVGSLLQQFASIAAVIHDNAHQFEERLHQRTEALERLVRIDPLTDLLNRRGMTERLDSELERARRHGYSLAILWIDVDHFKEVNDTLGHLKGDEALQTVAKVLRQCLRSYDHASRWGGDEFLVLLSPSNEQALHNIGERIRSLVEQASEYEKRLTVSIGAHLTDPGEPLESALNCADEALYAAKKAGRNVLHLYSRLSQTS